MAASDALRIPLKNTAYRLQVELRDAANAPVTDWTGVDSEISKDGAAEGDCSNEAVHVFRGMGYLDLTADEMNANTVQIAVVLAGAIQFTAHFNLAGNILPTADVTAIVAAFLAGVVEGSTTVAESLRLSNSANGGKVAGAGTATVTIRDLADSKARITATVDADGNRTAVTRDLT